MTEDKAKAIEEQPVEATIEAEEVVEVEEAAEEVEEATVEEEAVEEVSEEAETVEEAEEVIEEPQKEATEEEAETDAPGDGSHWYALQVYSGHENKVRTLLEKRVAENAEVEDSGVVIHQVLVPTQEVMEIKGGKKTKVTRNLYPGYILVEGLMNEETQYFINSVSGIIKFLGAGSTPQPLREREVNKILGRIDEVKEPVEIETIPFEVGDAVDVTEGPFSDFSGIVEEVYPEKGKVKVTVSLFGRPTAVELDYLQLKKT